MEFEFVLPQRNEDLLETTGNLYCVRKIFKEQECQEELRKARLALTEKGVIYIFDNFDVFYSVTENAKKLPITTVFRAMELLWKSIDSLGNSLGEFLPKLSDLNERAAHDERGSMLNILRMLVFAVISLVKKIDRDVILSEGKKQKKQATEEADNSDKWEDLRYKALLQLFNILELPLKELWSPPVVEEDFVNLCADFAYRTVERQPNKKHNAQNTSFQILGILLKNYNHSLVFKTRIFDLLKSSEHAATAIANGIEILYNTYGIQSIMKVIIEEILNGLEGTVTDGPVVKNISCFFSELGNSLPALAMPFIRDIAGEILNLESYQLRICILQLMSDIVMSELNGENLSQDHKDTRDDFLEYIYFHIHDINAHVRAKALGIWWQMKQDNAVPLIWLSPVVKLAAGRLEDKSCLVRKNAIHVIKSYLERNPYAAKLSLKELEKRYDDKLKELSDLRTKMAAEADKVEEANENWNNVLTDMKPHIIHCLELTSIEDERIRPEDCGNLYQQFQKMIENKEYERLMLLTRKAEELNGNWETISKMEPVHAQVYFAMLLRSYFLLQNSCKSYEEDYKKTENAVRFLEDSLEFSRIIAGAVPKLQELLMSKTDTDVIEAINFFTAAFQFGIKNTEVGMRQLLYLVWSVSKDKRGPIRDAYKIILFSTNTKEPRAHAHKAVINLMRFIETLTYSQFIAFEELVKEFVASEDIDSNMIQVMFEIYTKKLDNVSNNDSRLALQLLVIISNAKPSVARANAALLEDLCFVAGEGLKDSRVFTMTLDFLMNVHADKADEIYPRLEADDTKVTGVLAMYRKYFLNDKTQCFDEVCSKTFQYVYSMCHLPNVISQDVIKDLWEEMMKISKSLEPEMNGEAEHEPDLLTQVSQAFETTQRRASDLNILQRLPVTLVSRFIFMIGYVAMKELIYLDVDVFSNLKYRQDLTDAKKNKKNPRNDAGSRPSMNRSAMSVMRRSEMSHTGPDEEHNVDDVVGQSNDDVFVEQINAICENELLFHKDSVFNRFIPMIVDILKHPKKYNYPQLQRSALLALIHFMSVSSEFCEQNMQFLMNIFQHAQDIDIKCNVIIGMSDLTFRFPNVIEPWSCHLYSTLYDENRDLRLTSVRILAHLISHEMILVKGQISDLAKCIVDTDDEIRKTTEVFFKEIANKSNILYNVLPDIISRLSDPNLMLEEGKYQDIMKYIIGLVTKDRQIEGLVEKLCFRFKVTEQERQWRDIAYCLSLLSYTEKTIKKLIDNIVLFKDKVQVQEVYDYFKQIISNTLKLAKPELKTIVQDFEMKLEECLAVNDNPNTEEDVASRPEPRRINAPVSKRPGRGKSAKKPPLRRNRQVPSESESSSEDELENQPPSRQKGRKKVERVIQSDSEEEPVVRKKLPAARAGRTKKVILDSSSSDENPSHSKKPAAKRGKKR